MNQKEIYLSFVLFATAFVVLLVTLNPYRPQLPQTLTITPNPTTDNQDLIMAIQVSKCCPCPEKIPYSSVGKNDWVIYEEGRDYSQFLPSTCRNVVCKPCAPTTLYSCPASEWVDCMSTPNQDIKLECTPEALNWFKLNCPNFKGASL